MAQGRAVFAAVGLGIDIPSLAHSGGTRNVVAQVKTVVRSWQIGADTGVHFMVTIGLLVPVHEILDHVSCLALCSIESKRLANTPPRFFQLAAWCPPVFGGHHFKPLAEDLPCQANAAP
ncbi:hypothetical protein, partial [Pseudomonas aeruginosa]|uniref:hypothetical protein n=2 Tax=Pseudomonas aeruginosa TaxID=287 RepID=UPI0023402E69